MFEQAEGGTLFLDEIGELELSLQAKLLRVLEEGSFRRVGGLKDLPLDVRVIAASNRDLKSESEAGHFRADLFYRLSVIQIDIPPLRDRGDDIRVLAEHYMENFRTRLRKNVNTITPEALAAFGDYAWPGNVRELRNVIERAMILEDDEAITTKYLPRGLILVTGPTGSGKSTTLAGMIEAINRREQGHIITLEDPIEYAFVSAKSCIEQREIGSDCPNFASGLRHSLRQDPDVILVGEMRDLETVGSAITAAETGHRLRNIDPGDGQQPVDHCPDCIRAHRIGDVLDLLLALVLELGIDLALDRGANRFGHRHATRFGQALQPRRDVDAVAIHRAVRLLDHIAKVHADAKTHAAHVGHVGTSLS